MSLSTRVTYNTNLRRYWEGKSLRVTAIKRTDVHLLNAPWKSTIGITSEALL